MGTKKNKKYNDNSSANYSNFTRNLLEFNNISENEKYEKAVNLIQNIPNIEDIKDIDKLFYYGNVSSLYNYVSEIKCKKYGLSDGRKYNADSILEDKNREYLNEVLSYEISAFTYCKQSVDGNLLNDTLKKMIEEGKTSKEEISRKLLEQYEKNRETFRRITQELSILYYIIKDEDKFILYGDYAVEYNSLNVINLFLKYYCDKGDFDNANHYYELMHTYPIDFYGSITNNIALKVAGHKIYWELFYNSGNYEESLRIGEACKEFVLKYKLDNEILLYVEKHIKECTLKIQESNNNKYTEDKLLKYFDKEIIDLMSDDNKIYITTSLNIYDYMKSKEMDFSATLMPILKAVENMIFEIIGVNYHSFILERNLVDKNLIQPFINKRTNAIIQKMYKLELGEALELIGCKEYYYSIEDEIIPNKYFVEFCNKNNVIDSKNVIKKIYKNLDNLRVKRNTVAHKTRVFEKDVKKCYAILLDDLKFINFLYTNFRFVFEHNK